MQLRYASDERTNASPEVLFTSSTADPIDWSLVEAPMLCCIGSGDLAATYLVKSVTADALELSEIYRRLGKVTVTKAQLDRIRPVAFLRVPPVKTTKPVQAGVIYQVYPTGVTVTIIGGRRWLTIVDRQPIVLPTIPRLIVRKTLPAANTHEVRE